MYAAVLAHTVVASTKIAAAHDARTDYTLAKEQSVNGCACVVCGAGVGTVTTHWLYRGARFAAGQTVNCCVCLSCD
jgi:hypothetical protein